MAVAVKFRVSTRRRRYSACATHARKFYDIMLDTNTKSQSRRLDLDLDGMIVFSLKATKKSLRSKKRF